MGMYVQKRATYHKNVSLKAIYWYRKNYAFRAKINQNILKKIK